MSRRPLTPAQHAALDHDGDGKAGGSKPHGEATTDAVSENADNGVTAPQTEQEPAADAEAEQPETDAVADADGADAAAPAEGAADGGAASDDDRDAGAEADADAAVAPAAGEPAAPAEEAPHDAQGSRDGVADEPAPPVEDEDQAALAPAPEDENQALALKQGDSPVGQKEATAVNLDKAIPALRDMASNRYGLYRRIQGGGYTSDPAGGGLIHDAADVDALVEAGLAYVEPSGGQGGSVKITPAGREQLQLAETV